MIKISSVTNNKDGKTCSAVLTGTPKQFLNFYMSSVPESLGDMVSYTLSGSGAFVLTAPSVNFSGAGLPCRLYYVKAEDADGVTDGTAVWLGLTDNDDLVEIMLALRDRILANKSAIDARLKQYHPEATLKHVLYGNPTEIKLHPAIHITQDTWISEFSSGNWIRRNAVTAEISGFIQANEPRSEEGMSGAFARAVQRVLNQREYDSMRISSGILTGCSASRITFDTAFAGVWFSSWSMTWSGEYEGATP